MTASQREHLRRQYLAALCGTLGEFALAGHEVHIRTEHGRAIRDNRIIFEIPDWDAFARLLEEAPAASR